MTKALDLDLLRPLIADDPYSDKVAASADEVACLLGWAHIIGADYTRAVRAAYEEAVLRRDA